MNTKRKIPIKRKSTNGVVARKSISMINPQLNKSTINNVPVTSRFKENVNNQSLEKSYYRPTQCSRMKSNGNVKKPFLIHNSKKSLNTSRISNRKSTRASPLKELDMNSVVVSKPVQHTITDLEKQTINLIQEYGKEIEDYQKGLEEKYETKECLKNQEITPPLRAKMINWIIEVCANFKTNDKTFFLSISIMDRYLKRSSKKQVTELHLVGVTSMFIASKYEDIQPLRMRTVFEKIAHKKLSIQAILECEAQILNTLDYFLQAPTVCEFINKYITQGPWTTDKKSIERMSMYLAKMCVFEYTFCDMKYSLFAIGVLYVSLKIYDQVKGVVSMNKRIIEVLIGLSGYSEEEIIECVQKVLKITQNFDRLFPGLVNLKKFYPIDLPKYVVRYESA